MDSLFSSKVVLIDRSSLEHGKVVQAHLLIYDRSVLSLKDPINENTDPDPTL